MTPSENQTHNCSLAQLTNHYTAQGTRKEKNVVIY